MAWKDFFRATLGESTGALHSSSSSAVQEAKSFKKSSGQPGSPGSEKTRLFETNEGVLTDSPTLLQRLRGK